MFDGAGGVLALGREGRRLWSIKLGDVAAGDPVIDGDRVWLLDRTGRLEGRSLANGASGQRFDLGVLPAGGLVLAGSETLVPVARGTIAPRRCTRTRLVSREPEESCWLLKPRPTDRVLIVIASASCLVLSMHAGIPASRGQEPAAQEAAAPPTTDLLRSPPFDRITLTDGTVLIVDPVSPRPLPTPDPSKTKKSQKARLSGTKTEVPLGGNIGLPGEPSKFKTPQQEKEEEVDEDEGNRKVKIHLLTKAEVARLRGEAVEHQEY